MNKVAQKLKHLNWLKSIGIEYYFSERKDSNISWIENFAANTKYQEEIFVHQRDNYSDKKLANNKPIDLNTNDSRKLADNADSLDKLKSMIIDFNGCDLKNFAISTVFADGNPEAKIMLIGEAPGAKEDELGVPFCGESGVLLDAMLFTIGLSRKENIYITNTVFWRPPANRRPTKQEIEICRPFLEKHISLINPKLIICVGSTAVTGLLGDKITINAARTNNHFYQNKYLLKPINTMAIFHPAYLLRQPAKKKDSWFDLIKIQQFIKKDL